MLNALYWLSIALLVGLVSIGGITIYIGFMVAVNAKYAAEALCRRRKPVMEPEHSPEDKLRHDAIESFKASLCTTLMVDIHLRCPVVSQKALDETYHCCAPLDIINEVPDLKIPKSLEILVDVQVDDFRMERHYFHLDFVRLERDRWDFLWCVYRAVCPL